MKMILVRLETSGASNHRQTGVELHTIQWEGIAQLKFKE